MDLHGKWNMANQYATFIEGEDDGNIAKELSDAILNQKTWLSRGPILTSKINYDQKVLTFSLQNTKKPGYQHHENDPYFLTLRTKKGTICKPYLPAVPFTISFEELENETTIIPKLYQNNTQIENLVVLAPVIYL
jgi:hypothetical protein